MVFVLLIIRRYLPPSFLEAYRRSSLGCKALCIITSFHFLLSICSSSSLIHFKNASECITRGTAQVFIPLMRFLLYILVSISFLVFLFSFYFLHFCLFDGVRFQFSQVFVSFLSSESSVSFLDLVILFFPSFVVLLLSSFESLLCSVS